MAERIDSEHGLAKLQLLLGLLADRDCARRGLVSSPAQVEETLRWYRARYELVRRRDFDAFLGSARLCETELRAQMRTFTNIGHAQRIHAERVDQRMPRYQAVFSVRDWLLRREAGEQGVERHAHS